MSDDRTGTLGSVNIRLPHFVDGEERYRRTYKPVTPASRIVTGADDAIAPETDIASWAITDWSGGEGDVRWRDRGRYNTGTGVHWASDSSGLVIGPKKSEATGQAGCISYLTSNVYAARDMDDDIYTVSSGPSLSSYATIGGSAGRDAVQIALAGAPASVAFYVLDDTGDLRKVTTGSNSAWDTNSDLIDIISSQGSLYGLTQDGDLYDIDLSTASTRTLKVDASNVNQYTPASAAGTPHWMATTDTGLVYVTYQQGSEWAIRSYNHFTDTGSVIGLLPKGSSFADIGYFGGIVFAAYTLGGSGDAYLWYDTGSQNGQIGPIPKPNSAGGDTTMIDLYGDRLLFVHDMVLWAYDLSDGAIIYLADLTTLTPTAFRQGILRGGEVELAGDTYVGQVDLNSYEPDEAQTLSSGRDDFGYPGLPKLLHTVTVTAEDALVSFETVEVGYSVDGGSTTWLSDDFATGESVHQWTVSTNSSSVIGTEVEWHLRLTTTSDSFSPKIVGLYADASGARSRIEWAVAVDVDRSSTVEGEDVISALNALKTTHAVVQWSDPFQVGPYAAAETFDVRVLDVSTPEYAEGEELIALVKFQTVGVVGG